VTKRDVTPYHSYWLHKAEIAAIAGVYFQKKLSDLVDFTWEK
jgi:hypothetical protein